MLNVFITVDTEIRAGQADLTQTELRCIMDRDIYGKTSVGDYGLPFLLRTLNAHGLLSACFVEPIFASAVGTEALADVVGLVREAGHEVQLHTHTEWVEELPEILGPGRIGENMKDFTEDEQHRLIELGLSNLRSVGISQVRAFRAGNYGADFNTLRALARHGILFDTSYNHSYLGRSCGLLTESPVLQPERLEGVVEIPVNFFCDWPGHYRHTQLCACSFDELAHTLMLAWQRGWYSFVIVAHSFELLNPSRTGHDPIVVERLEKLCRFLAGHPDKFNVRGFDDLDPDDVPLPSHALPLNSSPWRTARRVGEQLSRRVRQASVVVSDEDDGVVDAGVWEVRNEVMLFRLGEISVGHRRLLLRVWTGHFTELPRGDESFALGALADRQVAGVLVRSQPIHAPLPRLRVRGGRIIYIPRQYRRYFVDLTGTYEQYLGRFSSKTRSTLRRKVRRFEKLSSGAIDWREYRTPDDVATFYEHARELSLRTYQERLLDAGLPASPEFRQQMHELAESQSLRSYLLFLEGSPIAYLYCPAADGVLDYAYLGYDPAFAKLSPGTVLQWLVLERLFSQADFKMFDFSEGEGAHKRLFATGHQLCADIYVLHATPSNLTKVAAHAGLAEASGGIVRGLERFGLKSRLKRLIRSIGRNEGQG